MKQQTKKQAIRIVGQVLIGLSVISMDKIGLWFLIPWCVSWFIYDSNIIIKELD